MDPSVTPTFREAREAWVRAYFAALFTSSHGNISEMARRAGMERSHLKHYLRRLGIRDVASEQASA